MQCATLPPVLVFLDTLRAFLVVTAGTAGYLALRWLATTCPWPAPLHRRLWTHPDAAAAGTVYLTLAIASCMLNALWLTLAVRNFVRLTLVRLEKGEARKKDLEQEKLPLPPWPYTREGFTVILGELQARDGARVPSERDPELKPRWLTLQENAQYAGVFVTGGIGSGKTAAVVKALCRSKWASCWELTQSHNSILEAFAPGKEKAAETYFQNSMTHIYLRQSDLHSMEIIQKEAGTKDIARTQLAVTEGGRASDLSYVLGGFVDKGLAMSSTRTVTAEEKPFVDIDELKQLPNNVALAFPSTGERTLPATYVFLRPLWVFREHPDLGLETPWLDWPDAMRNSYDLRSIPQAYQWQGWGVDLLDESRMATQGGLLSGFIQSSFR